MYLALTSKPDSLHSICKLTQRNTDTHREHEAAIKHIIRFLKNSILNYIFRSALKMVFNPTYHARSKHIDVRYDYKRIILNYSDTKDLLTKNLEKIKHDTFVKEIGIF